MIKVDKKVIILSLGELAIFYGISIDALNKRIQSDDFPADCKIKHGQYDLKKINDWVVVHFYASKEMANELAEAKLAQEKGKAEKISIQVGEMKKNLVPADTVIADLSMVFSGMRQRLMAWYKSLPPLMVGREEKEMGQILRQEVIVLLRDMSRGVEAIRPKAKKAKRKVRK